MELRAKKSSDAYSKLRTEVIALFAAFTAGVGLKDFISDTIKGEANLGRMSHSLDMSVENLSAWQGVLKRNGGTAEDATGAFRTLADTLAEIQTTGTTSKGGILMRLGIQAADLKDPQAAIIKMANVARTMDPVIASSLLRQVGFSEAMANAMLKGGTALQAALEAQRKLGVTTEADVRAAQKLQDSLEGLKGASARLGAQILTVLEPVLDLLAAGLSKLAEWAQRNQPVIVLALTALVAVLGYVAIAAASAALATSTFLAPLLIVSGIALAVGAALGVLYEVTTRAAHAFMEFMRSNKATRDAMAEVGQAASALWQAIVVLFAPLKPIADAISSAFGAIGGAIGDAFGGVAMATARTFINFLTNGLHSIADALRVVTALLKGDFKGALAAAKDFNADMSADAFAKTPGRASTVSTPGPDGQAGASGPAGSQSASGGALSLIKGFEGFITHAKWDRNAFRTGYGSDTTTDARTGRVSRVTASTVVSKEDAEADLRRRVGELTTRVATSVGKSWNGLTASAKDSLTSMAYNYGSLPKDVLAAAKGGNQGAISAAVARHASDNSGVNAKRRFAEAGAIGSANSNIPGNGVALGSRVQAANASRSAPSGAQVQIDTINVNAPNAKDAKGVAAAIAPALKSRLAYVGQVNGGLG